MADKKENDVTFKKFAVLMVAAVVNILVFYLCKDKICKDFEWNYMVVDTIAYIVSLIVIVPFNLSIFKNFTDSKEKILRMVFVICCYTGMFLVELGMLFDLYDYNGVDLMTVKITGVIVMFMVDFMFCSGFIFTAIKLYLMFEEAILYLVIGGLTTVINFIVFFIFRKIGLSLIIANIIAWTVAVIFAFYTNKLIVFKSEKGKNDLREFMLFMGCRVGSLVAETAGLWLMSGVFGIKEIFDKIVMAIVVVILNYFFSKFLIFTKKDSNEEKPVEQ